MSDATILYDADCGFCRWSLAKVLAWDRGGRLRPVALQDEAATALLGDMEDERRMASWHLVTPEGSVHSAGAATVPLLRLLPGGAPLAAVVARAPEALDRAYAAVAANRAKLGRLVPRSSVERATRRIERHGERHG